MRVTPAELDELFSASRRTGIALAIHAIGDLAATVVLDALERAPARGPEMPIDRMEHVQLLRPADRPRFAALGMAASVQPIHAAADRDLVDAQWRGRESDAYAWRSLADAGALLVAGSDAPVESIDPWLRPLRGRASAAAGRLARRLDARGGADHHRGAARLHDGSRRWRSELRTRATCASVRERISRSWTRTCATILAADERLAGVRSTLTLVDGEDVPRG